MAITSSVTASCTLEVLSPEGTEGGSVSTIDRIAAVFSKTISGAAKRWIDRGRSIALASEDLDLTALTQTLNSGGTASVSFSKVYGLAVINTSDLNASNYVTIGGAVGTQFIGANAPLLAATDKATIPSGGGFLLWCGPSAVAISNGVNDVLNIDAVGAVQTVDILIVGE